MKNFKIEWSVNDGFLNNGTHSTEIDATELCIFGELNKDSSDSDILDAIHESVHEDFQEKIKFKTKLNDEQLLLKAREALALVEQEDDDD